MCTVAGQTSVTQGSGICSARFLHKLQGETVKGTLDGRRVSENGGKKSARLRPLPTFRRPMVSIKNNAKMTLTTNLTAP
jgi:hypothetical protein